MDETQVKAIVMDLLANSADYRELVTELLISQSNAFEAAYNVGYKNGQASAYVGHYDQYDSGSLMFDDKPEKNIWQLLEEGLKE